MRIERETGCDGVAVSVPAAPAARRSSVWVMMFAAMATIVVLWGGANATADTISTGWGDGTTTTTTTVHGFDIEVTTPIRIESFVFRSNTASTTVSSFKVWVTAEGGTFFANINNEAVWTLVATASGTTASPAQSPTTIDTPDFTLLPGRYGMRIEAIGCRMGNTASLPNEQFVQTFESGPVKVTHGCRGLTMPNIWHGTINYSLVNPTETGACCMSDGSCQAAIQASDCSSQGGRFRGSGVTCAAAKCSGGCCDLLSASCGVTAAGGCGTLSEGKVYRGDGSNCSNCEAACCLPDGSCTVSGLTTCIALGGVYRGGGTACDTYNCGMATFDAVVPSINGATNAVVNAGGYIGRGTGAFFDIVVTSPIRVTALDVFPDPKRPAPIGASLDLDIYLTAQGQSYKNLYNVPSAWTKVSFGSAQSMGIVTTGTGIPGVLQPPRGIRTGMPVQPFVIGPGRYGVAMYATGAFMEEPTVRWDKKHAAALKLSGPIALMDGAFNNALSLPTGPFSTDVQVDGKWWGAIKYEFTSPGDTGACCSSGYSCTQLTVEECYAQSGYFRGIGITCSATDCGGVCCTGTICRPVLDSSWCAGSYVAHGTCEPFNSCFPADNCETTPLVASMGSQFVSNVNATTSFVINPIDLCPFTVNVLNPNDESVGGWWDVFLKFVPPVTAAYTLDTCGPSTLTTLSVHVGDCASIATNPPLACNRDSAAPADVNVPCIAGGSRIQSVTLDAGVQYYIRVAGGILDQPPIPLTIAFSDLGACCTTVGGCSHATAATCVGTFMGVGSLCMPLPCPAAGGPANDTCATAAVFAGTGFVSSVNNALATSDPMPLLTCGISTKDTWYAFTPSATSSYHITTCSSMTTSMDTMLSLHSACPTTGASNELGCNNDSACITSLTSTLTAPLTGGTTYWIRVASNGTSQGGPIELRVTNSANTGACCTNGTGACVLRAYSSCLASQGRTFLGIGTSCSPDPCLGACCTNGSCSSVKSPACTGAFLGYGFACSPSNPCPQPNVNCCRGTTCRSVPSGSCTGTFAGSNSLEVVVCGNGNAIASCCYADFNHDGTQSIDDLFLYFNAYFTSSPWSDIGGDGVSSPTIDDLFLYINAYFTGCA